MATLQDIVDEFLIYIDRSNRYVFCKRQLKPDGKAFFKKVSGADLIEIRRDLLKILFRANGSD